MEIPDIIAKATLADIMAFRNVKQQKACRSRTGHCVPFPLPADQRQILIDKNRAWVYCPTHAQHQVRVMGHTPMTIAEFLRSLDFREQALQEERAAQAAQAIAAQAARVQAEDVQAFLAQGANIFFADWTETEYVSFLETWPESALCVRKCGPADYALMVQTNSRSAKEMEVKAACEGCKKTAEALVKLSPSGGTVHSFSYSGFRLFFQNRLAQLVEERQKNEHKQALKRLTSYLKRFQTTFGGEPDEADLDHIIKNMDPALRARFQAAADSENNG